MGRLLRQVRPRDAGLLADRAAAAGLAAAAGVQRDPALHLDHEARLEGGRRRRLGGHEARRRLPEPQGPDDRDRTRYLGREPRGAFDDHGLLQPPPAARWLRTAGYERFLRRALLARRRGTVLS